MDSFRHVLAPVDFSAGSRSALALAATIARACRAAATVLHVYPYSATVDADVSPYLPQVAPMDEETRSAALGALSRLADEAPLDPARVHLVVREGDPSTEILDFAATHGVDLIVMGTHGRRGFDRLVLGSVTERVAQTASCSVLALAASGDPQPPPALARILCAVDLTPASRATLEVALDLAGASQARLCLVHVVDPWRRAEPEAVRSGDEPEYPGVLQDPPHDRMAQLLESITGSRERVDTVVAFGRPQEEIQRIAEQRGADLLVLGVHEDSRVDRVVFGSTVQRLLRAGGCPVLLARRHDGSRSADRDAEAAEGAFRE